MSCSLLKPATGVGLGDAEDRVVGVAIRTGVAVLTGLIEERVHLAPEVGEAQESRTAQSEVGLDRGGIDALRRRARSGPGLSAPGRRSAT